MLHGEIKVNDAVIGRWKAVRKQEHNGFCDYECNVVYYNMAGYPMEATWMLRGHAVGNGAISLTARILQEAMSKLKVRPPRDAIEVIGEKLK